MHRLVLLVALVASLPAEAGSPRVSRPQAEALLARWHKTQGEVRATFAADPELTRARYAGDAPAQLRARALRLEGRAARALEAVRSPAVLAALLRTRAHDEILLALTQDRSRAMVNPPPPTRDDLARNRLRGMIEIRRAPAQDEGLHQSMPYMISRGVRYYVDEHQQFGPRFEADLATWHAGMKILDGGAGEGRFFDELTRERGIAAEMVAVGIKIPASMAPLPRNVRYLEGKLGADRALEARLGPGTFDRIVDTLGASSYTHDLQAVLGTYGRLLKPGGKLFVAGEIYLARFEDADKQPLSLPQFLSRLRGFRVEYAGEAQFALVRTEEPLSMPRTRLVGRAHMLDRSFRLSRTAAEP